MSIGATGINNPNAADGTVADFAAAAESLCRRVCDAGGVDAGSRILDCGCGFGGVSNDYGRGIATDSNGNAWVTGGFQGSIDIDGDGNIDLTSNGRDSYLVKFSDYVVVTIDENITANAVVRTFLTTDPDTGNTFTYQLVAGMGDTDNDAFTIVGNQLQINSSPDFETQSSYSILVQTTDAGGLSYSKNLTININDVNEGPTDLDLSNNSIDENVAANTVVGTFSTTDPDTGEDTFTYQLVAGTGDTDNAAFTIVEDQLRINSSPDFETQSSYSILVQTTDAGGLSYSENFTININDVNEALSLMNRMAKITKIYFCPTP